MSEIVRVGIQTEAPGSYHSIAAKGLLEGTFEEVWYPDFPSLYTGLERGETDCAVAAYSTVNGKAMRSVAELVSPERNVWGSRRGKLPVQLMLVSNPGIESLEQVITGAKKEGKPIRVYSQLEAYAQCEEALKSILPGAMHVIIDDTAGGIEKVVKGKKKHHLALGSPYAAEANGGRVISKQLNSPHAMTSFMLLTREPIENQRATSSLFVVEEREDKPGVLVPILAALAERAINLAYLDGDKVLGRFVIEAEAGLHEERMQAALDDIRHAGRIRHIGSFDDIDIAA